MTENAALETLEIIRTRLTLRLHEAHRENQKQDDLNVGIRLGIYTALNIVVHALDDAREEWRDDD